MNLKLRVTIQNVQHRKIADTVHDQLSFKFSIDAAKYFTPNVPIDRKTLFAGRSAQILGVIDAVNQKGQHVILYGERGVGKTSLSSVVSQFLDVGTILCTRVHCDRADSFESLWKKLFSEIQMMQERQVPGFGDRVSRDPIPASELFQADLTPNGVRKALTRLSAKSLPILILDEFDRLDPVCKSVFADFVKMLSDYAVAATVVLVGVADSVNELVEEHESVERALAQIRLPRMSRSEIGEIVENGLRELGLQIEPAAKERIVLLAQGLPHYAHLLGLHSVRSAASRRTPEIIRISDVEKAVATGLANAQQSIRNAFHKATTSPRANNLYKQVLCACAVAQLDELGYFAAADVRGPLQKITGRDYGISAFARHLKEFCSDNRGRVLHRTGTPRRYRFRFGNPLMQPYTIMHGLDSQLLTPEML